ncbi:leukemia inhibitory factor receptor [Brachyistius frenatus]|uniref:leukemia inhibitory factor receptor n=1 Tax=Brachyistius frenatus TaxID=100188 RepID=UPI0037E6FC27
MISVRISLIKLGLYLIFSKDHGEGCIDAGCQLPKPSISLLNVRNDKQSLTVRWLVNHSGLVSDNYEIQIGRTEQHTIIYNRNASYSSRDSAEHTWTWISDLPLECVDHSVRIRNIYNQSVPSPWSDWMTNYGVKAEDEAKIFPYDRVLREGTSAVFCCVPPAGVNITSIAFRGNQYPLMSIGARVKAITVHNLTIPTTVIKVLLLSCKETTGNSRHTYNYVSFPPQKPRNLSCATSDMLTVTCTWDTDRKRDPRDRNKQTHTLHIENSDLAPINCEQSSCTFPAMPQLQEYNISVVVTDKLGEETERYSFNISDRVIPVVELHRESIGVTDASLSCSVQGNLTRLNLLCQVSSVPGSITELSCNSVRGLCEVKLEHLLPNTRYSTKVRCSVSEWLWGEWSRPLFFTTDPLVTLDLWRRIQQLSDSHSRQVTLLWNPHIVGTAATVNIQSYTVQWSQEGQTSTQSKDSGQSQAEVSIGPGKCDFTVQAVLHSGSSVPAHITIPPMDHTEKPPAQKRLSSTTAGGFNLSWDERSSLTCDYAVEWCTLGNAVPCTLQWIKVPEGNDTLFLPARHFKAGCRYTFNIYGCTEDGHRLLEIQTGYSQELKSVQSPILVEPVHSTSSSVTLVWHYNEDDPAQPAFITGYLVTVQEGGPDMLPGRAANFFNVSVVDPQQKSVTIDGLQQNQEYVFSLSVLTKDGPGRPTSITIRTRINYAAYLAKILPPLLLLLGCTILLWSQRKTLKRRLREIFAYPPGMNIKTPEFDNFLYETDQRLRSQEVEECISCDVEIVNIRPPLNETTSSRDPELTDTLRSPGSRTVNTLCAPLQTDYIPQSATLLKDQPASEQITWASNRSYLCTTVENFSELQQITFSNFKSRFEPSDGLQESFSIVHDYISNETKYQS